MQTLTRQGMLSYDPDRQLYALGVRLVRLAHVAWQQSSLAPIARPHLDRLAASAGETVHLAQLDGGQVLYVDKRTPARPIRMFSSAGKIGPAYCTGVGKAMLAFLPEAELAAAVALQSFHRFTPATLAGPDALRADLAQVRRDGLAYDREEHEPGIICVAAPILTRTGRVMGALSLTSATSRSTLDALAGRGPEVRATAAAIAEEAQDWRFPDETGIAARSGTRG